MYVTAQQQPAHFGYANLEKSGHCGLGYIRCRKGGVQVRSFVSVCHL
jgi:hypothetical protein